MPISSTCPNCQAESNVPDDLAGKRVKCPKCKESMRVPQAAGEDGFDVVDADDRPSRKSANRSRPRDDEEPDVPVRKKRRAVEDDGDDEPVRKKRRAAEDDGDDEEPVRKKRRRHEEDDDDRPRSRRSGKRSREESTGVSPIRYAIGGIVLVGLLIAVYFIYSSKFGAPGDDDINQKDPQLQGGPRPGDPQRPIGGKL